MDLTDLLRTLPPTVIQTVDEDRTWGIDTTAGLTAGASINTPTVTLTDLATGLTVTGLPAPTVAGNIVDQHIPANMLTGGHTYKLRLRFTQNGATDIPVALLTIVCSPL